MLCILYFFTFLILLSSKYNAIGANIDHVEADGWSALHFATLNGHKDIVVLLLQNKVDAQSETDVSTFNSLLI